MKKEIQPFKNLQCFGSEKVKKTIIRKLCEGRNK